MAASKVNGVYYFEYPSGYVPSTVPYTTWSGLLVVPPDSPYAARLQKCGGTVMTEAYVSKGKDIWDKDVKTVVGGPGWIKGFWTAPEDWPEMAAGREDPKLLSN